MTSYNISELPIPYRSAGASPLGTHEGTVTPPEPPTPPTPTGKVYFSGTSVDVTRQDSWYVYMFDPADGSNASDLTAKQVGDEMLVTIDGTTQTLEVTMNDVGEKAIEIAIGWASEVVPLVFIGIAAGEYAMVAYYSATEIPGGVTMTIADPA